MSSLESWLEPLRAYPRGWVLACALVSLALVLWLLCKIAKWMIYALALTVFAVTTYFLVLWLWE